MDETQRTRDHEYTGHVEPGGPSAVRTLPDLEIRKASVGPMDNNAYLLTCRASGAQVLIDAAADPERLLALIREGSPEGRLDAIITTHSHHDHVGALPELAETTGARTVAGAADAAAIPAAISDPVRHGDEVVFGEQRLEVIGLRGHTPGSIALLWFGGGEVTLAGDDAHSGSGGSADARGTAGPGAGIGTADQLFTGDSLFPGGIGNTDRDPERFAQLLGDVEKRVFARLLDPTWVYPGHGDDTTLGAERPDLPTWRERGW